MNKQFYTRLTQYTKNLKFKMSTEGNNTINYLDISIYRNNNSIDLNIYRKPTGADTTIHFTSNHLHEHKTAAFRHYIHRMITLQITQKSKQEEWNTILTIAKHNGNPTSIINKLRIKRIDRRKKKKNNAHDDSA